MLNDFAESRAKLYVLTRKKNPLSKDLGGTLHSKKARAIYLNGHIPCCLRHSASYCRAYTYYSNAQKHAKCVLNVES